MITFDTPTPSRFIVPLLAVIAAVMVGGEHPAGADWLGFRGDSSSSAELSPKAFSESAIAWRVTMPGRSVSSPIIIGDLVVTTSSGGPDGEDLYVTGVNLDDGSVRFEQSFAATGRPYHYVTSACAAATPVSDGERIYALFSSGDLFCLSLDGDLIWTRGTGADYPGSGNDLGLASSPVVHDGVVVVLSEGYGESFALGIDAETGANLWEVDREKSSNWSTPVVLPGDGLTEVLLTSGAGMTALDIRTGEQLWQIDESFAGISSAVLRGDRLFVPGDQLVVFDVGDSRPAGQRPEEVWREKKLAPANPSVATDGNRLYVLKGSVLTAAAAGNGEVAWKQRLSGLGGTWATPLVIGDRVLILDQGGKGLVVADRGERGETIAEFDLGDDVYGSPAASSDRVVIRVVDELVGF